jgi:predicted  nucleic acid-binding Zn-ribbon protein
LRGTANAFFTATSLNRAKDDAMLEETSVASVEERVADVEGQVSDQAHTLVEMREAIRGLEHRVDARFEAVDRRFEAIDRRFDTIERRIDVLDDKVSRQFVSLVGLQVTTLVATGGALAAVVSAVLTRA